jgi:hypothetical protein
VVINVGEHFKTSQQPIFWLLMAERLARAAENSLRDEAQVELAYGPARDAAIERANKLVEAGSSGIAEIESPSPNYGPARLMYGLAFENIFKGLMVAADPALPSEQRLSKELTSHDLVLLALRAGFVVTDEERRVLEVLSYIVQWGGRYPTPMRASWHDDKEPFVVPLEQRLDPSIDHAIMRDLYARSAGLLGSKFPERARHDVIVVWDDDAPGSA